MSDTPSPEPTDPSAEHRLPYTVEPRRYALRLTPDLAAATFTGEVRIEVDVKVRVSEIVLHAAELDVTEARFERPGSDPVPAAVHTDEAAERVTLALSSPVDRGPATMALSFTGILNDKLHGFYRSVFTDDDGTERVLATTQFEATDARRAFPCFDEPDRKAVFSVTLDVPAGLAAYSNGPALDEESLPGGARRIRFADTMPMSTYLVAFVVGPLVTTDPVDVRGTPVRIVHVPGKEALTAYALQVAAHALEFFSDWFGIDYPAEKLDLLAIPDFAFGAMENLGCVTFREALLLVDPARASRLELERVADVISHEIAHMWFGDLVTMRWWEGIWLNEAFATLMELLCVDALRPDWQRWVSFGLERDAAMATDSLHTTRPVEYPVGPPEEAQGMFDVLTYQKGAGVLRMLERYLGAEAFRDGVRVYLDAHRYGNTETADLWSAIERASGQPVADIMDSWLLQGGFPLLSVRPAGGGGSGAPGGLEVEQQPFSYGPPRGASAIGSDWRVPLFARAIGGAEVRTLLRGGRSALEVDGAPGPVIVNAHGTGYYRVRYTPEHLRTLASRLAELEVLERFNLLGDTWAVVVAGAAELGEFLVLAEALGTEDDPNVWAQVTGALSLLDHAVGDGLRPTLAAYGRALLAPVLARTGWDRVTGEDARVPTLRAQLIGALGVTAHDDDVRAEARRRYDAAAAGHADLDPDLTGAILGTVASSGGAAEFESFLERYRHPSTPQEEVRYLYALAAFTDDALAAGAFELARTEVRTQNAPFLIHLLLANRDTGPATWGRVRGDWSELMTRFPANIVPRMLDGLKLLCRDEALARDVTQFAEAHPIPIGAKTVEQTLERLRRVNVAFAGSLARGAQGALEDGVGRLTGA